MKPDRIYMCIDLKSFYASVECVERGLDPMKARLVVADPERSEKTICLAVSPAMKALGVKNRCRVFEIPKYLDYIMAVPRMALYQEYSARVYSVYLRHIAPEDIHVYSIDEVFMDITDYLSPWGGSPLAFARGIRREVLESTGLYSACGLGENLYLAKIAMDMISKRSREGIGLLSQASYRRLLWDHRPISDFWQIGPGIQARLQRLGISSMGELARAKEEPLYKCFGVDAELLIDHAWGRESVGMRELKSYRPKSSSLSSGQVLPRDYSFDEGRVIVREMAEALALELFSRGLGARRAGLSLGYSSASRLRTSCGGLSLETPCASVKELTRGFEKIYFDIGERRGQLRRVNITLEHLSPLDCHQYDMFSGTEEQERQFELQRAILGIKEKYGGGSIFRCLDLTEAATALERSRQIGGHKA